MENVKKKGILIYNKDTMLVTTSKGLFVINTNQDDFNFTKPLLTLESLQFKNNKDRSVSDMTDSVDLAQKYNPQYSL